MSGKVKPIRTLQRRIFAVITSVIAMFITLEAAEIFGFMFNAECRQADNVLIRAAGMEPSGERKEAPEPYEKRKLWEKMKFLFGSDASSDSGWIVIHRDSDGRYITDFSSRFPEDMNTFDCSAPYRIIVSKGKERGFIVTHGRRYRYLYRDGKAAMYDFESVSKTMKRLLLILLVTEAAALLALVPVVMLLVRWISKPIEKSWEQQRVFFSDASHELKTPLTVITANVDAIMSDPDNNAGKQSRWFGHIKNECRNMYALINEMLWLSKEDTSESVRKADVKEHFDFSKVTEGVCLAFEALAFERGKNLMTDIEQGVRVYAVKEEITRLVNILADNALLHSEEGGTVTVSLKKQKNKAALSVVNTGEGLSSEELTRIFDRFYRTDKSRASETGGFGLGLSIAKTIAEKNGGSLAAFSEKKEEQSSSEIRFVFKL